MSNRAITGFWFTLLVVRPACFAADVSRFVKENRTARRAAKENRKRAGLL